MAAGQNDLTTTAVLDYYLGAFNAAHPLTLFCYSQGAVVCNNDEPTLIKDGIPSDAIKIVEIGDTSSSQTGWDGAPGPIDGFLDNTAAPGTLTALGLDALGWGNLVGDTTPTNDYDTYVYTSTVTSGPTYPPLSGCCATTPIWDSRQRRSVLLSR